MGAFGYVNVGTNVCSYMCAEMCASALFLNWWASRLARKAGELHNEAGLF